MNRSFAGFAGMMFAALTGCGQGTPGGPGATGKNPTFGQTDDTFNLSVPVFSSSLKQGEESEATVGIKRARNFDQDVSLTFTDVPKGVTMVPAKPMIKHGDTDTKIMFKAGDETPQGDFKIKVTGHPTKGTDAEVEFKLSISPKDSFTLSVPSFSTSLKQGETQTFSIGIKRDRDFDQDVALKFATMPTGVTLVPGSLIIKKGEASTQVTLAATKDASLGNFSIKVNGHPAKGMDSDNEFSLVVVKK